MRRREFLGLVGAAAWPLAARAQQAEKVPRIGYLSPSAASSERDEPFRQGFYCGHANIDVSDPKWSPQRYHVVQAC